MSMLVLLSACLCFYHVCGQSLSVVTSIGEIRGAWNQTGGFTQFLGVPYAVVDENNLLAPSSPHPGFPIPFEANQEVSCYGTSLDGTIQCLVMNIFVPQTTDTNLPVMVSIHGGAFVEGSGNSDRFGPKFFIQKDVIVVTINYRLGIYGFMCTDSELAPGNNGLKDQLLALRWINEHIEDFGGDRNRITIFGESAGGMSVHLHTVSKYEKLFQRAIIQSGPANSPWATVPPPNNTTPILLAEALGYSTDNLDDALVFISRANAQEVVVKALELDITTKEPLTKPCVENPNLNVERFVEIHPLLAQSRTDIDVMAGYTSEELIFQMADETDSFFENYPFDFLLETLFNMTEFDNNDIDTIRQFYAGDEDLNRNMEKEIISYASDYIFNYPTEVMVDSFVRDGVRSVYKFMFSYEGGRNLFKNFMLTNPNPVIGASHADELGYQFDVVFLDNEPSEEDQKIIDAMAELWTNFAKYGDPTPANTQFPVKWEPVTSQSRPYLNFDRDITLEYNTYHERMAFWDLVYFGNQDKNLALRKG